MGLELKTEELTQAIKNAVFCKVFFFSKWSVGMQDALSLSEWHSNQKQSD
jgi:hypothetical protein